MLRQTIRKNRSKCRKFRLDELLLDVREVILRAHPDYHIDLLFEQEEADDDRMITVRGNLYLLNIAFSNLIENNCKYSADKSSFVQISYWDKWTIVRLSDAGVGMSETDKQHLFDFVLPWRTGQESRWTWYWNDTFTEDNSSPSGKYFGSFSAR